MFKLQMLKPRLKTLDPYARFNKLRTLKDKQRDNGRTLALDGKDWRTLRAYVLSGDPLCRHCTSRGLTVVATEVDHLNNDPTDNRLVNLQPLCKSCHSIKTMAELHGREVPMGCATDGTPLSPTHHWNKPTTAVLLRPAAAVDERSPATDDAKPTDLPCFNANRESVA